MFVISVKLDYNMYNKFAEVLTVVCADIKLSIVNRHYNTCIHSIPIPIYEIICNKFVAVAANGPTAQIYFDMKIREERNFKNIVM